MQKRISETKSRTCEYTTRSSHIERLALKEQAAWNEFYTKYRAMIFGIGTKRRLTKDECEDLLQEVAVICCNRLQNSVYDPSTCRFRTFLFKITEHAAFNILRKKKNPAESQPYDDYGIVPELDIKFMQEYEEFLLEKSFLILKNMISRESYLAFDMLFRQGLPIKEVVAKTGLSAPALYTLKHRCLKKLKTIISELMQEVENQTGNHPGS